MFRKALQEIDGSFIYIFDLDGTLADISHRLHFIRGYSDSDEERKKVDWNAFNLACDKDEPKWDIVELFSSLKQVSNIMICTGRMGTPEVVKKTLDWLAKYGINPHGVYFRSDGDYRSDDVVKKEMLDEIRMLGTVVAAIDDRDRVVDMWRDNGVTCLQCQKGDY